MSAERCVLTDLLVESCGHCNGAEKLADDWVADAARMDASAERAMSSGRNQSGSATLLSVRAQAHQDCAEALRGGPARGHRSCRVPGEDGGRPVNAYQDYDEDEYDPDDFRGEPDESAYLDAQAAHDYDLHCKRVHGGRHCDCPAPGTPDPAFTGEPPF